MKDGDRQASVVLRPRGPLEVERCGHLRSQLAAAFCAGVRAIVVDLRDVPSIDLHGLGVLAGAARHLQGQDGALVVVRPTAAVRRALRVNDLTGLLDVPASPPLRAVEGPQEPPAATPRVVRRPLRLVPVDDDGSRGMALPG